MATARMQETIESTTWNGETDLGAVWSITSPPEQYVQCRRQQANPHSRRQCSQWEFLIQDSQHARMGKPKHSSTAQGQPNTLASRAMPRITSLR
jgi:hypothetical protein